VSELANRLEQDHRGIEGPMSADAQIEDFRTSARDWERMLMPLQSSRAKPRQRLVRTVTDAGTLLHRQRSSSCGDKATGLAFTCSASGPTCLQHSSVS
jgi:hypothetical protein